MAQERTFCDKLGNWLNDQGHFSEAEFSDEFRATVTFKSQGVNYRVLLDEREPSYITVMVSYTLEAVGSATTYTKIACDVMRDMKVVKIEVHAEDGNFVQFAAEQFIADYEFAPIFWRCTSNVRTASDNYFRVLRESQLPAQRFIADAEALLAIPANGDGDGE